MKYFTVEHGSPYKKGDVTLVFGGDIILTTKSGRMRLISKSMFDMRFNSRGLYSISDRTGACSNETFRKVVI